MALNFTYFAIAVGLFFTELAIALGLLPGAFVRGSIGDLLVIALIYFFIRGTTRMQPTGALAISLLLGLLAELLQALHIVDLLGLQKGSILSVVIGNTFSYGDLVMYLVGGVLAAGIDTRWLVRMIGSGAKPAPLPQ